MDCWAGSNGSIEGLRESNWQTATMVWTDNSRRAHAGMGWASSPATLACLPAQSAEGLQFRVLTVRLCAFSYGSRLNEAFSSRSVQTGQQAPRSVEQLHWIPISWPPKEKEKRWEVERGRERECRSRVKARQGKGAEYVLCK
jgi:hypothetical protein